jgi:hypothetical protein
MSQGAQIVGYWSWYPVPEAWLGTLGAEIGFGLYPPVPVEPVLPVVPPQAPSAPVFNMATGTADNPNPYGVDISCWDDIDPYFSLIGGIQVLAQDLYHRVTCDPGSVPGAPNFGYNCRALLSASISQSELQSIQSNMTTQLQADERVMSAQVSLSFDYSTTALTVTAVVLPFNPQGSPQPFQFVASISVVGSTLLSVSPSLT